MVFALAIYSISLVSLKALLVDKLIFEFCKRLAEVIIHVFDLIQYLYIIYKYIINWVY